MGFVLLLGWCYSLVEMALGVFGLVEAGESEEVEVERWVDGQPRHGNYGACAWSYVLVMD